MMKKCLVIVNSYNEEAISLAESVESFLQSLKIISNKILYSGQKSLLPDDNIIADQKKLFEDCCCAITLGGDGTVLFAARICAKYQIPIFPVNLGQFGFIAGIQIKTWKEEFQKFIEKKSELVERSMVKVSLYRNEKLLFSSVALNDVTISGKGAARIVTLDVSCNENSLGCFKADGIIVATATGSTAYSVAAGGPIVDPQLDALVLSPICPFSLSNRPLVFPSWSVLKVKVLPSRGTEVCLTCDGQITYDAQENDIIQICKAEEKALLVGCDSKIFYDALRSKLNWSGGPLA